METQQKLKFVGLGCGLTQPTIILIQDLCKNPVKTVNHCF